VTQSARGSLDAKPRRSRGPSGSATRLLEASPASPPQSKR
jgi:hypothetical protein